MLSPHFVQVHKMESDAKLGKVNRAFEMFSKLQKVFLRLLSFPFVLDQLSRFQRL